MWIRGTQSSNLIPPSQKIRIALNRDRNEGYGTSSDHSPFECADVSELEPSTFHSGYPYTPVSTRVGSYIGNVTQLRSTTPVADFLGGDMKEGNCSTPFTPCLQASQFASSGGTSPVQADFGNVARNSFQGPGYFDTDMNLMKSFRLTERLSFAVGANFFNLFNHPNFDLPTNNVANADFGKILNTVVPATTPYGSFAGVTLSGRIVQMNARLAF